MAARQQLFRVLAAHASLTIQHNTTQMARHTSLFSPPTAVSCRMMSVTRKRRKPNRDAKLSIVLREDVEGLGVKGSQVEVRPGYGRNFLIPSGKAAYATVENIEKYYDPATKDMAAGPQTDASAQKILKHLHTKNVIFRKNKTAPFTISAEQLAAAIRDQLWMEVPLERIELSQPISTLGPHRVPIHVDDDNQPQLQVDVVPI